MAAAAADDWGPPADFDSIGQMIDHVFDCILENRLPSKTVFDLLIKLVNRCGPFTTPSLARQGLMDALNDRKMVHPWIEFWQGRDVLIKTRSLKKHDAPFDLKPQLARFYECLTLNGFRNNGDLLYLGFPVGNWPFLSYGEMLCTARVALPSDILRFQCSAEELDEWIDKIIEAKDARGCYQMLLAFGDYQVDGYKTRRVRMHGLTGFATKCKTYCHAMLRLIYVLEKRLIHRCGYYGFPEINSINEIIEYALLDVDSFEHIAFELVLQRDVEGLKQLVERKIVGKFIVAEIGAPLRIMSEVACCSSLISHLLRQRWWAGFRSLHAVIRPLKDNMRDAGIEHLNLHEEIQKVMGYMYNDTIMSLYKQSEYQIVRNSLELAYVMRMACDVFTGLTDMSYDVFSLYPNVLHAYLGSKEPSDLFCANTPEIQEIYMCHLKTLSSEKIKAGFIATVSAFSPGSQPFKPVDPNERPGDTVFNVRKDAEAVSHATVWRQQHPGVPFGYVWGLDPHHHCDFMLLALKRQDTELLKFLHFVFGLVAPNQSLRAQIDSIVSKDAALLTPFERHVCDKLIQYFAM
jgi:hypothetical protein